MNLDLEKAIRKYGGKWVVIDDDLGKVVISGSKATDVYKIVKKRGYQTPHLFKVPVKLTAYIGISNDLQI